MTRADLDALDAMEAELPNLRVALDHAVHGRAEVGLRLVAALTFFWSQRGLGLEGAERAARVLAAHPDAAGHLRARAWAASSYDRFYGGDFPGATADADQGLAEAVAAGDVWARARCRHAHGEIAFLSTRPRAEPPWPRRSGWPAKAATGGARPMRCSSCPSVI